MRDRHANKSSKLESGHDGRLFECRKKNYKVQSSKSTTFQNNFNEVEIGSSSSSTTSSSFIKMNEREKR